MNANKTVITKAILFTTVLLCIFSLNLGKITLFVVFLVCGMSAILLFQIINYIRQEQQEEAWEHEKAQVLKRFKQEYAAQATFIDHEYPSVIVTEISGEPMKLRCVKSETTLHIISAWSNIKKRVMAIEYANKQSLRLEQFLFTQSIPLGCIHFFQRDGDVYTETHISGGSSGGSSLEGAIIGGLVAGGVGAIIGSRKSSEPIQSETIKHDSRKVILLYKANDTDNTLSSFIFSEAAYSKLLSLLPEKEYYFVVSQTSTVSTNSISKQIRELALLNADGILSDSEFKLKKAELLNKL